MKFIFGNSFTLKKSGLRKWPSKSLFALDIEFVSMVTLNEIFSIGVPLVVIVPVTPSNLPQNIPAPKCWTRNNPIECVSSIFQIVSGTVGVADATGLVVTGVELGVFCVLTTNINRKEIAIESDGMRDKNIMAPW